MNKYASIYIIFIFLLIAGIASLIIPSGEYIDGNYERVTNDQNVISELINAPINGYIGLNNQETIEYTNSGIMSGVVLLSLLITSIYMYVAIILKVKIIENFLNKYLEKIRKKNKLFIFLLITFFSFAAFTHGMYETAIALALPLFVIFSQIGYNKHYVIKLILYSTSIGYIASTINPFATKLASDLIGVSLSEQFYLRLLLFIVLYSVTIIHLLTIKNKYQLSPLPLTKVDNSELRGSTSLFIFFILPFIIMSYSFLPNELPLQLTTYGIIIMFLIFAIVIGFWKKLTLNAIVETFINSIKDVIPIIVVLSISRGIYILLFNLQIDATIIHYLTNAISGLSPILIIIIVGIFYMLISLFISSSSAVAYLTIPILGAVFIKAGINPATLITLYQGSIGILHIFSLTSVVVISLVTLANIKYTTYLKESYKYIVLITIITFSFIISTLIF